jgi:hypothetical protein
MGVIGVRFLILYVGLPDSYAKDPNRIKIDGSRGHGIILKESRLMAAGDNESSSIMT